MSDAWFERDADALPVLEAMLRARFPTLHAFIVDGVCRVRGGFEAVPCDIYGIEVALPSNYPATVPSVWETDGRIPRELDRHVYPDGSLCLGTPLSLWLALDGDFGLDRMLDIPVRNFLIGNSLVEKGEPWPYDDYAHGPDGIVEHLKELVGIGDGLALGRFLLNMMGGKVRGHWPCPCGSGEIIRRCHREGIETLRRAPRGYIMHAVESILKGLQQKPDAA